MKGGGELTLTGNIPNGKEFRQSGGKVILDSSSSRQQILRHLVLGDASGQSGILELRKGRYKVKVRVRAAGDDLFSSAVKTVTVSIKVTVK
jgi:hypothetical protein